MFQSFQITYLSYKSLGTSQGVGQSGGFGLVDCFFLSVAQSLQTLRKQVEKLPADASRTVVARWQSIGGTLLAKLS